MVKADAHHSVCRKYFAMKNPGRKSPRSRKSGNSAIIKCLSSRWHTTAPRRTVSIGGRSAHASVFYLKHVVLHWRVEGGIIFTQRVNRPIPCWVFDDKTGDLES